MFLQYVSRLSRENFDLKLRLRLERERADKSQRELGVAREQLVETQKQLAEVSTDVEELDCEMANLHAQLRIQDDVLSDAVTVVQNYEKRQAQMEHLLSIRSGTSVIKDSTEQILAETVVGISPFAYKVSEPVPSQVGSGSAKSDESIQAQESLIELTPPFPSKLTRSNILEATFEEPETSPLPAGLPSNFSSSNSSSGGSCKTHDSLDSLALSDISERDLGSVYGHSNGYDDGDQNNISASPEPERSVEEIMERAREYADFFRGRVVEMNSWIPLPVDMPADTPTAHTPPPPPTSFPKVTKSASSSGSKKAKRQISDTGKHQIPEVDSGACSISADESDLTLCMNEMEEQECFGYDGGGSAVSISTVIQSPLATTSPRQRFYYTSSASSVETERAHHVSSIFTSSPPRTPGVEASQNSHISRSTITPRTRALVAEVAHSVARRLGFVSHPFNFHHKRVAVTSLPIASHYSKLDKLKVHQPTPHCSKANATTPNTYISIERSPSASVTSLYADSQASWESVPVTVCDGIESRHRYHTRDKESTPRPKRSSNEMNTVRKIPPKRRVQEPLKKDHTKAFCRVSRMPAAIRTDCVKDDKSGKKPRRHPA